MQSCLAFQLGKNAAISMTPPKTCQNCRTWLCQTNLQQVLAKRQECETSVALQCLWAWWVFQKLVWTPTKRGDLSWRMAFSMWPPCQKGCWWRVAPGCMGCTEQRSALFSLWLWPTHPVSFFSPLLGKDKKTPTPSSCPQVQGGGPGTAKLLSPAPAVPCSDHPEMLEEHWDAQKMPLNMQDAALCERGWDV